MSKKAILLTTLLTLILTGSTYLDLFIIGDYWTPYLISLGGVILICVLTAIYVKKEKNGYASFGLLIKHYATSISIAVLFSSIIGVVQLSIMDEIQKYTLIDTRIEKIIKRNKDMSQKELANLDDTLEERINNTYEPSSQILGAIPSFLLFFIISFLPAVILKKNPPAI